MRSLYCLLFLITIIACTSEEVPISVVPPEEDDTNFSTPWWTAPTHGNETCPNYKIVFPDQSVNTLEITLTESDWMFIQSDMKEKTGMTFGSTQWGTATAFGDPAFVAVSVKFRNKEWYKVGFRVKGNSSLATSWMNGIFKIPFRLKFDEFEDKYPQIEDQRFYGFQELTMAPGVFDNSLLREKVAADIFRNAGIPAAQTAFYRVYIDFGKGKKYCGIYTMVEVIDDTMLQDQFGEQSGNLYKPTSNFKHFSEGDFEKKTNKEENDFEDVKAFISALHDNSRLTDKQRWRTNLEATFHVDHFIRWLAANSVMSNYDTYGTSPHNYYLYNHSEFGLTFIPWDLNDSMKPPFFMDSLAVFGHSNNREWPLIDFIMDDPIYSSSYKKYIKEFIDQIFNPEEMNPVLDFNHQLIAPHVIGPENTEAFPFSYLTSSLDFRVELTLLKQHVADMNIRAKKYLE